MLSLFECIRHSLSMSLEEIKLITIVNWLLMMSFKYGLFPSRGYSIIPSRIEGGCFSAFFVMLRDGKQGG